MATTYSNEKEDAFFERHRLKLPERNPHLTDDERDELLRKNLEGHKHSWTQQGNEIFCTAGVSQHGFRVTVDVRLVGTDPNTHAPLLEKFTATANNKE